MGVVALTAAMAVPVVAVVGGPGMAAAATTNGRDLQSVSCTSTTFCMAVGSGGTGDSATLTESWNGSAWSVVPSPSPGFPSRLNSVSCLSSTDCVAVGIYVNSAAVPEGLAETWSGTNWSLVSTPNLNGAVNLSSVSCVTSSPISCVAVGAVGDDTPSFPAQTLAESWNGSTWSVLSTSTSPNQNNMLRSVSCTSTTFCMAVGESVQIEYIVEGGQDIPVFGSGQALVESWDGTNWSIDSTANENASDSPESVSCTGPTSCVVVGTSFNSWNGTSWTVKSLGTYPAVGSLAGASCVSATDCMAVGLTLNPSPGVQEQTLAMSWNGTALSVVPSANPSGVVDEFGGVACISATFCVAVGETGPTTTNTEPLFETWNGTTWSTAPVANTAVILPSSGTALSGTSAVLDATASASAGVASVRFVLTGGSYSQTVIGTATPTLYGYIFVWNTTGVPGGTYALQSLVTDDDGNTAYSPGITITVDNTPPATAVLIPSNGAALSGTGAVLDASASNATSVKFLLFGGIYGYAAPVICTTTPTYYGWLCSWNTTTVPDGSYALVSEAFGPGGSAYSSAGVSITVDN
jgi:hypothetical protein